MDPTFPGPKSRCWGADFGPKWTWRQATWVSRAPGRLTHGCEIAAHSEERIKTSIAGANSTLLGLLHDLKYAPALLPGDGARLGDADEVADAALVLLVVDLEPRALLHRLAVQAVGLR